MPKNQAESVKGRLLKLARERKEDFNFILRQYVLQRLMYRLSVSEYVNDFLLKGGLLFWVWNEDFHRPTKDMDLLGFGSDDITLLKDKFLNIISIEQDDGLFFDPTTLQAIEIKEDAKYQGIRITGRATLVKADIPYQIDIGFGDAVIPVESVTEIPAFLDDLPLPSLKIYPIESVLAEKFHAMVFLGLANSRMKDFFDIVTFASIMPLESVSLQSAIQATFNRRGTVFDEGQLSLFSKPFKTSKDKQMQWEAFIRKNSLVVKDDFSATLDRIQILVEPLYQRIATGQIESQVWNASRWRWE